MTERLERQAEALHHIVTELVKQYQFRDRQAICCHGISVSQYYALEALDESRKLTMGELATQLYLTVSTMTRIIDQLVARNLVSRWVDSEDHRVCDVALTQLGQSLLDEIRGELLEIEKGILSKIKPDHRETVLFALKELSKALDQWGVKAAIGKCKTGGKHYGSRQA